MRSTLTFWFDAHLKPTLAGWITRTFQVDAEPLLSLGLREASYQAMFNAGRQHGPVVVMTKHSNPIGSARPRKWFG